jgi:hypothetical protein
MTTGSSPRPGPLYARDGQGRRGPPASTRGTVDSPECGTPIHDECLANVEVRGDDWQQTHSAAEHRTLMSFYSVTQMREPERCGSPPEDMESFIEKRVWSRVSPVVVDTLTTARLPA